MCQSRFGESLGPASHLAVRSPRARMFQVPTRRFVSVLAGMTAASAARSRSKSSVAAAGLHSCRIFRMTAEIHPVRSLGASHDSSWPALHDGALTRITSRSSR